MMKFVLLVAIFFVVLWIIRRGERADARPQSASRPPPPVQQEMVECPVCGVHLPRTDALPGPDGRLYCCAEHRQRAGA
jgi:uncharacterized protein